MRFSKRVTLGPVREYVVKTEPGLTYNITITSINNVGHTVADTTYAKLPAKGMQSTLISCNVRTCRAHCTVHFPAPILNTS